MGPGRRLFWLACLAGPSVVALELASCSSSDGGAPAEVPDAADAARDRNAPIDEVDAPFDAPPRPVPTIPGCLGESMDLVVSGERVYAPVDLGAIDAGPVDAAADADAGDAGRITGDFLLDFGSNGSTIDLGMFNPAPPVGFCGGGDAGAPGALCSFSPFDFFGPWGTVQLVTADYSFLFNSIKQAGIIGTDFLSVYPFTFDFVDKKLWKGSKTAFCSDAELLAAGYVPIPTGGFYTSDYSKLRPLSEVIQAPDAAATANFTVPNIPTVPVTIGGIAALAQLDTGYDDRIYRHSININQALLDKMQAASPDTLVRSLSKDLFLTTCVPGLSQRGHAYRLAPGTEVDFLAEGGAVGRIDQGNLIFVKETLPAAAACGGIETWTVPAAQFGASFVVDAQAAIFDPQKSRVWVPRL